MIFKTLMVATFVAALLTMLTGVARIGKPDSNILMRLRVTLCAVLLVEILVYAFFLK